MTTQSPVSTPRGNLPACVLVAIVYLLSFFLPAKVTFGGEFHGTTWGLGAFILGLLPPYTIAWLANPALWLGLFWMIRGTWNRAWIAGVVSVLCAATMMLFPNGGAGRDSLAVGYFVWLASTVLLAGATLRGFALNRLEITGQLRNLILWLPRAFVVLAALPVAWAVFTVPGRLYSVDYFATRFERPEDGALALILRDPSQTVRLHAAAALAPGHSGDSAVNKVFCEGLRSADPVQRARTLEILRALPWPWSLPLAPTVPTLLKDSDANVRLAAAQLLRDKPFYTAALNWTDNRTLLFGATNDPDQRVSAIASDLLEKQFAVHKPKQRDPSQDKHDPALVGTWRAEYDEAGRHYVDVVQFDASGAWTNWRREVWTDSSQHAFVANPQYSGTWRIEDNVIHTQEAAPVRYEGRRTMGKPSRIEPDRFTLDRKGVTIKYQRVPTEVALDVKILLEPTKHD